MPTTSGPTDFYATCAQVIPVLLLALVWESNYLQRIKDEDLTVRRFWTGARIRLWSYVILPYSVASEFFALTILAGWVDGTAWPRVAVAAGLVGLLVTLLVRMVADVRHHTGA